MAVTRETMTDKGWFLTEEGLSLCVELCSKDGNNVSQSNIIAEALNLDLRRIGQKCLNDISKLKEISHKVVLQIQKVINVAVPSSKSHDDSCKKRLLKLHLTDGHSHYLAIEYGPPIPNLRPSCPPGTKILISGRVNILGSFLLLTASSTTILGGCVEHMVKKWSLEKTSQNFQRVTSHGTGPPPFIPLTASSATPNSHHHINAKSSSGAHKPTTLSNHQHFKDERLSRHRNPPSQHDSKKDTGPRQIRSSRMDDRTAGSTTGHSATLPTDDFKAPRSRPEFTSKRHTGDSSKPLQSDSQKGFHSRPGTHEGKKQLKSDRAACSSAGHYATDDIKKMSSSGLEFTSKQHDSKSLKHDHRTSFHSRQDFTGRKQSSKHHDEAQNYTTSTGAYNWESVVSRSKAPCTAKETDQ